MNFDEAREVLLQYTDLEKTGSSDTRSQEECGVLVLTRFRASCQVGGRPTSFHGAREVLLQYCDLEEIGTSDTRSQGSVVSGPCGVQSIMSGGSASNELH